MPYRLMMEPTSSPPRLATRLLEWALPVEEVGVLGDLEEDFHDYAALTHRGAARRRYWWQVLTAMPAFLLQRTHWNRRMLSNHVKVAVRTLARNKAFSAINILGLAASLAVALLILTFLWDQGRYDHFHAQADRIFRVTTDFTSAPDGRTRSYATSPAPLGERLKAELPEVTTTVQLRQLVQATSFQDRRFGVQGFYASSTFFQVFGFPLRTGDPDRALSEPYSIVLTEETAAKLFDMDDPTGQTLTIADVGDFTVTGVLAETPYRSHLEFEALASLSTLSVMDPASMRDIWEDLTTYTYLVLDERTSPDVLSAKLPEVTQRHYEGGTSGTYAFHLQAVTDINLGPLLVREAGRVTPRAFGYFLGILAVLIVLAACINYVNLSVARALKRAREVGVRKVMGAPRWQIVQQFLSEAVVVALAALAVAAVVFVLVLLPRWNALELVQTDFGSLILHGARDLSLYVGFGLLGIFVGLSAGLYPALYLSGLRPIQALKGVVKTRGASGISLRKVLIVFQFALSLIFMISTLLIYRQSVYMLNADFGFNQEHIVNVELADVPYETLRDELLRHPGVEAVSATSELPAVTFAASEPLRGAETADSTRATVYAIDPHFLDNLGLELVAGRTVNDAYATDRQEAVLLNETAVRTLGLGTPEAALGQWVTLGTPPVRQQVVGVIKDFQFDFLWEPVTPLAMRYAPEQFRYANVRLRPRDQEAALPYLETTWTRLATDTNQPFIYHRFEEQVQENYRDFQDFIWIIGLLAGLAILIACLGLLAMAHYDTALRVKEIGVRKVLGARVGDLVLLLSKGFVLLVVIAIVIAVPAAWFVNSLWLQIMANRIAIGPSVFMISIAVLLGLALAAIGSQTVRAALANPVRSIRQE